MTTALSSAIRALDQAGYHCPYDGIPVLIMRDFIRHFSQECQFGEASEPQHLHP